MLPDPEDAHSKFTPLQPRVRRTHIELSDTATIILMKIGGIGDYVLMTAALRALRQRYPAARIDCMVSSQQAKDFLLDLDLLNDIIVIDGVLLARDPNATLKQRLAQMVSLKHRLRSRHYDAVLCFNHLLPAEVPFLSALMIITGATYRVGLECGATEKFLHVHVPDPGFGVKHEAEYRLAIVEAVGAVVHEKQLFVPIRAEQHMQARALITLPGETTIRRPLIAIHPGCYHKYPARRWMPERFSLLATRLYDQYGGLCLLLGGPEEAALRAQVRSGMGSHVPSISLGGDEALTLTAAILAACDLFIGNDSGIMHIATAVHTPTLGIFGLTNPHAWGPYRPDHPAKGCSVYKKLACMPCNYLGLHSGDALGCDTRDCLTELSVAAVAEVAQQMLDEQQYSWRDSPRTHESTNE